MKPWYQKQVSVEETGFREVYLQGQWIYDEKNLIELNKTSEEDLTRRIIHIDYRIRESMHKVRRILNP